MGKKQEPEIRVKEPSFVLCHLFHLCIGNIQYMVIDHDGRTCEGLLTGKHNLHLGTIEQRRT